MGLTRPKIWDIDTNVEYFMDPITVLHQGSTSANVDVGFLFNRANGLVSNVALFWSESTQSFVTAYSTSTGVTNSNIAITSYANLTVGNVLLVTGSILNVVGNINANINASTGTSYFGNVYSGGYFWANGTIFSSGSTFTGGYVPNQTTFGANLVANSGVASTSTTTGALVVSGGAGITGALVVAGGVGIGGSITVGTTAKIGTAAQLLSFTSESTNTAATITLDSYSASEYRTAKYVVQAVDGTNVQVEELLVFHNGTDAYIIKYGTGTSNGALGDWDATFATGNVTLAFTPSYNPTALVVKTVRTAVTA